MYATSLSHIRKGGLPLFIVEMLTITWPQSSFEAVMPNSLMNIGQARPCYSHKAVTWRTTGVGGSITLRMATVLSPRPGCTHFGDTELHKA